MITVQDILTRIFVIGAVVFISVIVIEYVGVRIVECVHAIVAAIRNSDKAEK